MSDGDPYRNCIWCGVDCYEDEPEHAEDCPQTTGLRPVREEDLGQKCIHCGERTPGMTCMDCGVSFAVGDFYVLRDRSSGDVESQPYVGEIICVGCGAGTLAVES